MLAQVLCVTDDRETDRQTDRHTHIHKWLPLRVLRWLRKIHKLLHHINFMASRGNTTFTRIKMATIATYFHHYWSPQDDKPVVAMTTHWNLQTMSYLCMNFVTHIHMIQRVRK